MIDGGRGDDMINGHIGNDIITGGPWSDTIYYFGGTDRITDFDVQ
ncbi:hypothetical protein [Belnapia arida]